MQLRVMHKRPRNSRLTSKLQEDILKHIAVTPDAGYDTMTNKIKKNRITIRQSIETLLKHNYAKKEEIEPDLERNIKIIFKPTTKGITYSMAFLEVGLDEIIKSSGEENDFIQYNQLIENVVDKSERNEFIKNTAKALIDFDIFDNTGEMRISKGEDFFNYGIMMALTGLGRKKSPSTAVYFDNQSIESLRKILSEEELKGIREYFSKVQTYLNKTTNAINDGISV